MTKHTHHNHDSKSNEMAVELAVDEDGVVDKPFINLAIVCCIHKGTDVSDILRVEVATLESQKPKRFQVYFIHN